MIIETDSEQALKRLAGQCAQAWADGLRDGLIVGLSGDLGAGKTTWVRAMLRGLGHAGRVPSPTYTLLEHYEFGPLTVVHLDLYRLAAPDELEFLGLRDWLARPRTWILAEWPDRGGHWVRSLDLVLALDITGPVGRKLRFSAESKAGEQAISAMSDLRI